MRTIAKLFGRSPFVPLQMHMEKVAECIDRIPEIMNAYRRQDKDYEFHTNSADYQSVERLFVYFQILSASFVAFAHGANDVANAIGPMSAVISVAMAGGQSIAAKAPVPLWVLALGGLGIITGLATWGWRVMETIGRNISALTPPAVSVRNSGRRRPSSWHRKWACPSPPPIRSSAPFSASGWLAVSAPSIS